MSGTGTFFFKLVFHVFFRINFHSTPSPLSITYRCHLNIFSPPVFSTLCCIDFCLPWSENCFTSAVVCVCRRRHQTLVRFIGFKLSPVHVSSEMSALPLENISRRQSSNRPLCVLQAFVDVRLVMLLDRLEFYVLTISSRLGKKRGGEKMDEEGGRERI